MALLAVHMAPRARPNFECRHHASTERLPLQQPLLRGAGFCVLGTGRSCHRGRGRGIVAAPPTSQEKLSRCLLCGFPSGRHVDIWRLCGDWPAGGQEISAWPGPVGRRPGCAPGWGEHRAGFRALLLLLKARHFWHLQEERWSVRAQWPLQRLQGFYSNQGSYNACTSSALGPPGTAWGTPLFSLPTWGTLTAKDHAQQVPPVCSRDPLSSAFLLFPRTEAERVALRVLLLPWLAV